MPFPPPPQGGEAAPSSAHGGARGKLAPPHFAFEPVLPQAVEALLPAAEKTRLVVIGAPTGYGKTVLMSHLHRLARQRLRRCLWVTLDDRDAALGALLHLVEAARRQEDGDATAAPPEEAVPREPLAAADALLGRLDAPGERTALFIDNLGFCRDPLLPAFLERLVFGSGRGLQLVLSSVDALPLDLLRARLELDAVELAAPQLGFDRAATKRLLQRARAPVLDEPVLDRVQARTEGWPVAVRLLQILLSERGRPQDLAAAFEARDPQIAAVLTRSVLAQLPPRLVAFMVEMAHVREFSAELATHMTGHAEAGEWIGWLVSRNVLVFPLDRDHRWVRMHTLLRQHLLAEAALRLDRDRRGAILRRAAAWQADHGDDVAALEAALDAPAPALAARLLDRVAASVVGDQGRLDPFIDWVRRLEAIGAGPTVEAQAWQAWALCFTLQYERAQQAIEALDVRLGGRGDGDGSAEDLRLRMRLGLLRVVVAVYRDALDTARADARAWLAQAGPRDALSVATVAAGAAIATLPTGDFHAAREFVRTAAGAIARSGSDYGHAWVALIDACVELADGEPAAADRLLRRARREAAARPGDTAGVMATIDFVHARALLDLGQAGAAREKALCGLATAGRHGIGETALHGLLACTGLWRGEAEGPFSPESLDRVAHSYPPRIARWLRAQQVRRLLRLDRREEALALARRHALEQPLAGTGDPAGVPVPPVLALLDIDLRIARGEMREAAAAVEHHLRIAQAGRRARDLIELHLQAMEIHARSDEPRKALRALTLAIAAAARQRIVQPFRERLALIGEVLRDARPKDFGFIRPEEVALMDGLREACRLDAGEEVGPGGPAAGPDAAIDALTPRERQLLGLLHDGLDNRQIADRTGLSVPTIKWHLTNTYAKLRVGNRSAALAVARARNLLPR